LKDFAFFNIKLKIEKKVKNYFLEKICFLEYTLINMEKIKTRFAPSPTGFLHLGSIRTALFNFLFARKNSGIFLLRIEDTDKERCKKIYEEDIKNSLKWLNLNWDEGPYYQSERLEIYNEFLERLKEKDAVYYCYCQESELEERRKLSLKRGIPPKYDGRCRNLTKKEIQNFEEEGRVPCVRFKVKKQILEVEDLIRGKIKFDTSLIGDFIIFKQNKIPTFLFANAVDDALMEITHVIRGDDHLSNTPRQILIQKELNLNSPFYAHLPMILSSDKSKLSKRIESISIRELKEEGFLPEAILNYVVFLGWSPKEKNEIFSLKELIEKFTLEKVSKSSSIFDIEKLKWINSSHLKNYNLDKLTELVKDYLNLEIEKEFLKKIVFTFQDSVVKLSDFKEESKIFLEEVEVNKIKDKIKEKEIFLEFSNFLENIEIDSPENLKKEIKKFIEIKKISPKEFFSELRLILTGRESGPEIQKIIYTLGKEKTLNRIRKL
jgi:glutamyl-tRNA synthetase